MRTEKIVLSGFEYEIKELPTRKNAAWRHRLQSELAPLGEMLTSGKDFKGDIHNIQITSILDMVHSVAGLLAQSADTIRALVYEYAPAVARDAEKIEDGAYDSEYLDAFVKVLGLAYPFGSYVQIVQKLSQIGSQTKPIGMNSV